MRTRGANPFSKPCIQYCITTDCQFFGFFIQPFDNPIRHGQGDTLLDDGMPLNNGMVHIEVSKCFRAMIESLFQLFRSERLLFTRIGQNIAPRLSATV